MIWLACIYASVLPSVPAVIDDTVPRYGLAPGHRPKGRIYRKHRAPSISAHSWPRIWQDKRNQQRDIARHVFSSIFVPYATVEPVYALEEEIYRYRHQECDREAARSIPKPVFVHDESYAILAPCLSDHDLDTLGADPELPIYYFEEGHLNFRYSIGELLGSGGSGDVLVGLDYKTSQKVAIKTSDTRSGSIEREFNNLMLVRELRHHGRNHIVDPIDFFWQDGRAYLILPLRHGSLEDFFGKSITLSKPYTWSYKAIQKLAYSLLMALSCLSDNGYAHCDVKPGNVLLSSSEQNDHEMELNDAIFELADFGGLIQKGYAAKAYSWFMKPPETANGEAPLAEEATDMWAVGRTITYMLQPEFGLMDKEYFDNLVKQPYQMRRLELVDFAQKNAPKGTSREQLNALTSFLASIFEVERKRLTIEDAFLHPFIRPVMKRS